MDPVDPQFSEHALDVAEFWAKVAGVAVAVWQFVERVAKPFTAWRRRRLAETIREILKDDLACLAKIDDMETAARGDRRTYAEILRRQDEIFHDLDDFLRIAADSIERHEETSELLDEIGFTSNDRRQPDDPDAEPYVPERRTADADRRAVRRAQFDAVLERLHTRQRDRRRRVSGDAEPRAD